jgi:hypothetical protein
VEDLLVAQAILENDAIQFEGLEVQLEEVRVAIFEEGHEGRALGFVADRLLGHNRSGEAEAKCETGAETP